MKCEKVKIYKAWFCSSLDLEAIGDALCQSKIIEAYAFDYENVYEWLVCDTSEKNIQLNISRKHCDGEGFQDEPIGILVMYSKSEPDNAIVENAARDIASCLGVDINLGFIDYLGGDDYEYRSMSVVRA